MDSKGLIQHVEMANGAWFKLSLVEQMGNAGSEVFRALQWRRKGNADYSQKAFDRAIELLSLTLADAKNKHRLKEVARVNELLLDFFIGSNEFNFEESDWEKYFLAFSYRARNKS